MINHINMTCDLDHNRQPIGPHQTTMTLTPVCEQIMKERVFPFMEIEVLQGTRTLLDDGQIEYKFLLDDEKATALRKALVTVIFPTTNN
ncbi:hypothetical protein GO755_38945 [Spirosoma sp. HMF4905]|uniref:Uncharacterized protein n=1 Tax=Spirosoma arboris TaxID=2682092 RepID=A0A7K1SR33_9BACT|nr:hypothetical protein [Spirosoma arboris]MVM36056.1 hypothetical protein [Spirosoma arboris]